MNINTELVKFASQDLVLARSANEREKINKSLKHLEKLINDHLGVEIDSFLHFGSFTRNTILPRNYDKKSDVDLMIIFDSSDGVYNPSTYRTWLSDLLKEKYPNSYSKKDFPSVKLELNHIMFDLVPAYAKNSPWSGKERFFIPKSGNEWMETFPNDINSKLSIVNQRIGNNILRNVIRLCKHWNAESGYPFSSYLFEKEIIIFCDWNYWSDDTYSMFYKIMNTKASNISGVSQALQHIKKYQGDWFTQPDEQKQFQWLQKLLPGL